MSTRARVALAGGASVVVAVALLVFAAWPDSSSTGADGAPANDPHRHTVHLRGFADDVFVNTCAGVLVDARWVLTVKHCWTGADAFIAVVGLADWTAAGEDPASFVYESDTIVRQEFGVDLAMVRLDRPVADDVGVPLARSSTGAPPDGTPAAIAGWGVRDGGERSPRLDSFITIIDADCGRWGDPETDTEFLEAGFDPDITVCTSAIPTGACTGDSGGPVVITEGGASVLVGIVAFGSGEGCGVDPLLPDGHVAVEPFAGWIEGVIAGS